MLEIETFIFYLKKYGIWLVSIAVLLLNLLILFFLLKNIGSSALQNSVEQDSLASDVFFSTLTSSSDTSHYEALEEEKIYVDIKGAVQNPGMYEVTADMRLIDAVQQAGGFTKEADKTPINLSLQLEDQMVIYIPVVGETEVNAEKEGIPLPQPVQPKEEGKVNINTAEAEDLQELSGIGQKKAERIILYREEKGSFQTIEELMDVSGIGEKTFDALKDSVTVGD